MILAGIAMGTGIASAQESIRVDNLAESQVGQFPKDWKTYPFHKNKAKRVYKVEQNGGDKFIQAVDHSDISVPIFKDFEWDVSQYPYLKFQWRAVQLPTGSKETHPDTNDSACGVFVGFSRTQALKYVWSDSLTPGSSWEKNPGKYSIISRELGETNKGRWQQVVVDVPKDFQRYMKKSLDKNPIGIGMLTDGNAVHKPAACDYKDFFISKTP